MGKLYFEEALIRCLNAHIQPDILDFYYGVFQEQFLDM